MADKIVAAIIADTHVAPETIARVGSSGDAMCSVRQFVADVTTQDIRNVVFLGDINNKTLNRSKVNAFWVEVARLFERAKVKVHFIQGNHDEDDPPYLSAWEKHCHVHQATFSLGGLTCYGLDFQRQDNLATALADVPTDVAVLFTHQGWKEWMRFDDSYQGSFAQIPASVRYLISGDNHKHIFAYKYKRDGGDLLAYSPGSSSMTSIAEDADKYYLTLSASGKIERQKLNTRRVLRLGRIDTVTQLEGLLAELPQQIDRLRGAAAADGLPIELWPPYVQISYHYKLTDLTRRVRACVGNRAFLFWDELQPVEQEDGGSPVVVQATGAITPLTCLDQEVDPQDKPQVHALLRRVLVATNPEQEFARWQEEFIDG